MRHFLAAALVLVTVGAAVAGGPAELELLGEVRLPTGIRVDGLEVGGLSGIAWDPSRDLYVAVSDDRGVDQPIRFVTLRIEIGDGRLEPADVTVVAVTALRDASGRTLPPWSADLEGLARAGDGSLFVSSEGDPRRGAEPFLARLGGDGELLEKLPLPHHLLPGDHRGVRTNLSLESLCLADDDRLIVTATENALLQDGPEAGLDQASPVRIMLLELPSGRVVGEYLYRVEPIPVAPRPAGGFATNGLSELLAVDEGRFFALERWFAIGAGHGARLYEIDLSGATDLAGTETLADLAEVRPVAKRLVLDLSSLGIPLDNLEGMTWGPRLRDGRRTLIMISDNNFKPLLQFTQVLAFAVGPSPPRAGTGVVGTLQGRGHASPRLGEWADNVEGVVTAGRDRRRGGGVFVQADPDGDAATSDAIWVRPEPEVDLRPGDLVRVAGLVVEGGRPGELTVTGLDHARVERIGSAPLPDPVRLGRAGRVPPARVVDDDGMARFEPERDALDFFESLEGMRVVIGTPRVVGPTSRFGELWVVADGVDGVGPGTARGGLLRTVDDLHPEAVPVEGPDPPAARVGSRLAGAVEGVLDFAFGRYRVTAASFPEVAPGGVDPETADLVRTPGRLTMATFNVENLAAGSSRIGAAAAIIAHRLHGPELVALQEIQDDSGPRDDGTVTAAATLDQLVAAIAAAGGPDYDWLQLDPRDGREGGQPGGNIRVALLVDRSRVTPVRRADGPADRVEVLPGPHLAASPARLEHPAFEGDPDGEASGARRPLVVELEVDGRQLFVVVVHLTSKGGDDRAFGPHQPPSPRSEAQRLRQAFAVRSVVERLLAVDPLAAVVVLGDFNEFEWRPPMRALEGSGMVNLTWRLPENERYSYVFQGSSQAIDHILVSPVLARGAEVDVVHVNAEFPARGRASDHDPVIARVVLGGGR